MEALFIVLVVTFIVLLFITIFYPAFIYIDWFLNHRDEYTFREYFSLIDNDKI